MNSKHTPAEIIRRTRDGISLTREEIEFFITGLVNGQVADYQAAAWAMAVYFRGMTSEETADLAMAMAYSGDVMDLSGIEGIKVDKHSTGGVGDKTTPIVVALCAAAGIPVAKLSGRGLGFTGGTIDKFESIPGFRTELSQGEFIAQVNRIKAAVIAQSGNIVPADKKLYALRDVTATIDSIPLIASSVMSKKIASGADAIVLDIKVGQGAFMKNLPAATELAKTMVSIGRLAGRRVTGVLSDMDRPLGFAVGNLLEIQEAVDLLCGKGPADLEELSLVLAAHMILLGAGAATMEEARTKASDVLHDGRGFLKLQEMVAAQGGQSEKLEKIGEVNRAKYIVELKSDRSGWITRMETDQIGRIVMLLGAGRERAGQTIDHAVGLKLLKKTGEWIEVGDAMAEVHANDQDKLKQATANLLTLYSWGDMEPDPVPLVLGVVEDTENS